MAKKFKFDIENLDFKKQSKAGRIIKIVLGQIVAIIFLAIGIFLAFSYFTDTPFEKNLKYQNKVLEQEYNTIITKYEQNEKNLQALEKQDYELYQVMFGKNPPENKTVELLKDIKDKKPIELTKINKNKLEKLYSHIGETKNNFEEILKILEENQESINTIPSIQPVPNSELNLLLYGFGQRLDPIYHTPDFHPGLDFNAPIGTPVFATANGTVKNAGRGKKEQGNIIEIKHGDFSTAYYHLDKIDTRVGKTVKRGEVIGYVGTSGKSLVSHLHYEVRYKDEPLNPIFFFFMDLTPEEFSKVYVQSTVAGISLD